MQNETGTGCRLACGGNGLNEVKGYTEELCGGVSK